MAASIRSWQSLPVGVVSIAEKFGGVEVSPQTFEDMVHGWVMVPAVFPQAQVALDRIATFVRAR